MIKPLLKLYCILMWFEVLRSMIFGVVNHEPLAFNQYWRIILLVVTLGLAIINKWGGNGNTGGNDK